MHCMGLRGSAAPALPLEKTEAGWVPLTQTKQFLEQTHGMGRVLDLHPRNSSKKSLQLTQYKKEEINFGNLLGKIQLYVKAQAR